MNGEERERARYEVEYSNDVQKLCVGDTLNIKFEIKISISEDGVFSERIFKSFIDDRTREFIRDVCYSKE